MRVFIALELPKEIKVKISLIQNELKKAGVQARWIKPEMAHLTLAFLGSTTPDKIKPIEKIIKEVASQIKPINLHSLKINCFPNSRKPRVIYFELGGEVGKLHDLALKIRKGLEKENILFDNKPFAGHITLGRIKQKQNLTELIKKTKIKRVKFEVKEVALTKSTLTKSSSVYNQLKCVNLQT